MIKALKLYWNLAKHIVDVYILKYPQGIRKYSQGIIMRTWNEIDDEYKEHAYFELQKIINTAEEYRKIAEVAETFNIRDRHIALKVACYSAMYELKKKEDTDVSQFIEKSFLQWKDVEQARKEFIFGSLISAAINSAAIYKNYKVNELYLAAERIYKSSEAAFAAAIQLGFYGNTEIKIENDVMTYVKVQNNIHIEGMQLFAEIFNKKEE